MKTAVTLFLACLLVVSPLMLGATPQKNAQPQMRDGKSGHGHTITVLADEVRHQLLSLPYYGVFDWLEAQVLPDDSVILRGQVVVDSTKSDAEAKVRKLEGVTKVVNEIEILPAMPNDRQIRQEVYRAIYKFDSPLFQYAERAVPPIHIIVKDGHVTLKGVVGSEMDKQLVFTAASGVRGVFDVKNELAVGA